MTHVSSGGILSPPNPFHGTVNIQQAQVLERLKQLRQWQKQQQDHLLRQQQHELESLKPKQDVRLLNGKSVNTQQRDAGVRVRTPPKESGKYSQEISVMGNLQPEGHTISGTSLHSADSGMLSAQSSATDVKENSFVHEEQQDCQSGSQTPESNGISDNGAVFVRFEKKEERKVRTSETGTQACNW